MEKSVLILGAGVAGVTVAETLRSKGHKGGITLIGDEAAGAYHRPPLSKGFLVGKVDADQLAMRKPDALQKLAVEYISGVSAIRVDREQRRVEFADGSWRQFDQLAFCTGARPRIPQIPGITARGVFTLRTLADAQAIASELPDAKNVVVIGGGFIGLEVASVMRLIGKSVTIVEAADRLMGRAVGIQMAQFFEDAHRQRGALVMTGASVVAIEVDNQQAVAVCTADGKRLPADLVIVGVGVIPNTELAQSAGLDVQGGIVVDSCCQTSVPGIVAAGDCAARLLSTGQTQRIESIHNAVEQGKTAAAALLGVESSVVSVPWFYSDQYDLKLQMAGISTGFETSVVRGNIADEKFSVCYFKGRRMIATETVNFPAESMAFRKLLGAGRSISPEQAGDTAFSLASVNG